MNRVQHHTNNSVIAAPPGVPIEECTALAYTQLEFLDGVRAKATYWSPTPLQLALINAGHPIRLIALGELFAPVILGVEFDGVLPSVEGIAP